MTGTVAAAATGQKKSMKKKALFSVCLNIAGGAAIGLMISVCFLFSQEEIYENSRAFFAAAWRLVWR